MDELSGPPAGLPETQLERGARRSAAALALRTAAEQLDKQGTITKSVVHGGVRFVPVVAVVDWLQERAALIEAEDLTLPPAPGTPGFATGSNCRIVGDS